MYYPERTECDAESGCWVHDWEILVVWHVMPSENRTVREALGKCRIMHNQLKLPSHDRELVRSVY